MCRSVSGFWSQYLVQPKSEESIQLPCNSDDEESESRINVSTLLLKPCLNQRSGSR